MLGVWGLDGQGFFDWSCSGLWPEASGLQEM